MNKNLKTIPNFKNIKDEADFWDSHDIGDFMGDFKIVNGSYEPSGETKTTMTIRLDDGLKKRVEEIAKGYDISTSSLVRMWMVDRLRGFTSQNHL